MVLIGSALTHSLPMAVAGKNDVETEVFNVTDAQQLGVWAKVRVGWLPLIDLHSRQVRRRLPLLAAMRCPPCAPLPGDVAGPTCTAGHAMGAVGGLLVGQPGQL